MKINLKRRCPECRKINYDWIFYPIAAGYIIAWIAFEIAALLNGFGWLRF